MKGLAMIQLVLVATLCEAAVYYGRPAARRPAAFRPGVAPARPPLRPAQPAARRAPFLLYRSPQRHRYAVKQVAPSTARAVFAGGPWRSALPPAPAEYELLRAASAPTAHPTRLHLDSGAIHTIPAPNLSLSERPIVVLEDSLPTSAAAEQVKNQRFVYQTRINKVKHKTEPNPSYEVTEKYVEPVYQMAKIETPVGFSNMQSIQASPELATYLRNGAALQLAADYGLSAVSVPHRPAHAHPPAPRPHHFPVQGFQSFAAVPQQELVGTGADSVMIPPNVLYQSDPLFLQKLQQQLLQRFPALEFVPYAADLMPQNPQTQQLFLLENEEIKQPEPFLSSESKNVVQRETQEGSMVTLTLPQPFVVSNVTEKTEPTTIQPPHNITVELVAAESQPVTTTIKYVIETEPSVTTEAENAQNTTPIYYAQVGQSVGNVIANGFYTAMNDVRAAAALEQVAIENPQTTKAPENDTTASPISADLKQYFVQNEIENKTVTELKPLHGVPFAKPAESIKVAYTLLRTKEKEPKRTQEGAVYAGQIVEASISEDHDFDDQKATLTKRAPIRLYVADQQTSPALLATSTPKVTLVKAKIPSKSKLTFDDKTGEPVLRIYASYVDSTTQRQAVTSKLARLASPKPAAVRSASSADKSAGFDGNQIAKFGLKLRARSDDYVPLFQEYDD